jgi:hypothetical protein
LRGSFGLPADPENGLSIPIGRRRVALSEMSWLSRAPALQPDQAEP